MNFENYKSVRKGKPQRKSKHSGSKSRMLKAVKEWTPMISPKLLEVYSTKTEWVMKIIPKLKKEKEET
jgi:hypothetical protein